ncbi:hypothetical protein F0562_022110 [Nyssa sinensis]|uniref:Phosphoribosyltransferase domain-containing protein n=1 Tax=Nyssa sinensis TaxID=561372 RepID=A0A5J5BMY3_9ASTE|nr:hypothetical protein F0562_022110 [Nyssa sinensis]
MYLPKIEVMNLIGDVKGKVAVMVDDMIDTAEGLLQKVQLYYMKRVPGKSMLAALMPSLAISNYGSRNLKTEDGATGIIPPLAETRTAGLKDRIWASRAQEDSITWTEKCNIKEAVVGACLVFCLTDVIEK